ncbi:biotin/lipoyl-containing protein, partial [Nocardia salmonicida]|uniref:biotin/lipoyl-containing protein n=1 Tax=Nocardia salmonicida TaxID=53431 RepID=UPI00365C9F46
MPEIVMPRLSDTMEDGVVSAWLKQVGDQITRGEIVAEIETDKALMELEAYDDGVLEKILAEPGVRVPIGEPIAIVGDGTASSAVPANPKSVAVTPSTAPTAAPQPGAHAGLRRTGVVKSSPLARKIAREMRVDIDAVVGTGPGGRITRRDVEAAHSAAPSEVATPSRDTSVAAVQPVSASGEFEEVALTNIQRVSAVRLTESKQQAPHFYLT